MSSTGDSSFGTRPPASVSTEHHFEEPEATGLINPGAPSRSTGHVRLLFWGSLVLAALVFLSVGLDPSLPVLALVLIGRLLLRQVTRDKRSADGPLASSPSSGQVIGGFLASLEVVVTGQQAPVVQIEEHYDERWTSVGDLTVTGLEDPIERTTPPDRSQARL